MNAGWPWLQRSPLGVATHRLVPSSWVRWWMLALAQCGPSEFPSIFFLVSSTDWVFTWLNIMFLTLRLCCLRTIMLSEIKSFRKINEVSETAKFTKAESGMVLTRLGIMSTGWLSSRDPYTLCSWHTTGVKYFFLNNRDTREDCRYTLHLIYLTFP